MTVLVIDDEEMIRNIASRILKRAKFDVLLAETGEEGLAIFKEQSDSIHLVILDYSMEGLTGTETLHGIRNISPKIPAIISSGHQIDLNDLSTDLIPNTAILQKPYRVAELVTAVEDALAKVT